jgi:hypothetical protein
MTAKAAQRAVTERAVAFATAVLRQPAWLLWPLLAVFYGLLFAASVMLGAKA